VQLVLLLFLFSGVWVGTWTMGLQAHSVFFWEVLKAMDFVRFTITTYKRQQAGTEETDTQ
jgi:hypothetical protein